MLIAVHRLLQRTRRDESGGIIIAVMVILIVTVSLTATLSVVGNGLTTARTDQDRTNAFQFANAGVDQATYRIDQRDITASSTYNPIVTPDGVTAFTESVACPAGDDSCLAGSRFDVSAVQDPPGQDTFWTVRSMGTDPSGKQRLAIATVAATPVFQNGFFTTQRFDLRGEQVTPVAYRSSICPNPPATPSGAGCNISFPVPGRLGTNADFLMANATITEFIDRWEGFNMYGRATQAEADLACYGGRCGTAPKVAAITERYDTTVPPAPPSAAANGCPWPGGVVGADGVTTTIAPGDYACTSLHLRGTINVAGTGNVRIWVTDDLTLGASGGPSGRAVINRGQRPVRFQLYYPEDAPGSSSSSICNAEVWGMLDTPGLEVECTGSHQPTIWGAVVANMHDAGGNHFDFHWDLDTRTALHDGKYVVRNWRECPPGATDC